MYLSQSIENPQKIDTVPFILKYFFIFCKIFFGKANISYDKYLLSMERNPSQCRYTALCNFVIKALSHLELDVVYIFCSSRLFELLATSGKKQKFQRTVLYNYLQSKVL